MWIVFLIVVVVPAIFALGVALHYYGNFRQTEAYRWRNGVLERASELDGQYREELNGGRKSNLDAIRGRYYREHLETIRVDAVAQFTGIGPGTVDRLRQAGLRTLADLIDYPFHRLPGIGPSKSADLRTAVRSLVADAERQFDAGDCAKGRECRREIDEARRRERNADENRDQKLKSLLSAIAELEPDVAVARSITLWRFFWNNAKYPGYEGRRPKSDPPIGWPAAWSEPEDRAGTAETDGDNDLLVTVMPARNSPSPPMSPPPTNVNALPIVLDLTVQCATCDARLRVTSSKQRTKLRVTCPRCGTANTLIVSAPAPAPLPVVQPIPIATPIPPPAPKPVNVPVAARSSTVSPVIPPRVQPPPVVPTLAKPPVDIFAQALKSPDLAPAPPIEHSELPKLRTFAGFGLMVAKADGRIAKAERNAVRDFLASFFGHDPVLARHIDPAIEAAELSIPLESVSVAQILVRTRPEERRTVYLAAEKIADACGKRNRPEIETLQRIAAAMGVDSPKPRVTIPPPPLAPKVVEVANSTAGQAPSLPEPRTVLEIESGVQLSVELIRRRFTLLFEKADPAKAAALGTDFAAMAEKKRADLRVAALELIAPFGEPLDPPAAPQPPSDIRHNPDLDDIFGG